MSKYLEQKKQVLDAAKMLSEDGYFGGRTSSGGNVSVLVPEDGVVVVTPSSLKYGDMAIDDICVVTLEQNRVEGQREPSVETPMHIAVYQNRKDVNAVVHTHQPFASVFAILNEPIPALFDEVVVAIGDRVEVVPYGLSGSPDLLNNVVSKLGNRCNCYLLQNHGALNLGKNLEKALLHAELLEKTASAYQRALATGKTTIVLPEMVSTALFSITQASQEMEIMRKDMLKGN